MPTYQHKHEPFTYLIGWTSQNIWYYGVRYASGCSPKDLWAKYFTSSVYVSEARKKFGEPDLIQIRKTFETAEEAIKWEINVLRKMRLHERSDFLNKSCAGSIYYDEEVKAKISNSAMGNKRTKGYTNEYRKTRGLKLIPGKPKGAKHSEKARKERSEMLKGKPVHINLKRPIGINHSKNTKEKLREKALSRETFLCETCSKTISGKMNWKRHIESSKHLSQLQCI